MVTHKLKGVFKVTSKGRTYYYAWRGGPRIEAEYGTPEFLAEYVAAASPLGKLDRARMAAWVTLYRNSDDYRDLSEATKRNWGPMLDEIKDRFGALPVRCFDRPQIRKDIKEWRKKWRDHHRMADVAKQTLSRLLSFMVEDGVLTTNICAGIPNLYSADRAGIIWTDEDLALLAAHASPEVMWAARLAALTGIRQGDLLRLTWSQVGDLAIEIRTSKSRGKRAAVVPITRELRNVLSTVPKRAITVLTNTDAKPWKSGFGASWQAAIKRSGLGERNLHFHDLRGTAATKFYVAGLTSSEIADILGWSREKVERMIDRYVKRDELMRDRIRRLERQEDENRKTDSKTGGAV